MSYDDRRVWQNIDLELKDELLVRLVSTLECLICSEVMHVPFLAMCGHSFCYGCLSAWFETKINCPTCRAEMQEPPVLNIKLKDACASICDLIIDTMEDDVHKAELQGARARLLAEYDTANRQKALFGDSFKTAPVLLDNSDGVLRCSRCHWEAHGLVCLNCGLTFRTPRGDSYYDSEDGDAYNEDAEEVEIYDVGPNEYDSQDSFLDDRDEALVASEHSQDALLLSGEENHPESGLEEVPFHNFRRDRAMYWALLDDGLAPGLPLLHERPLSLALESNMDLDLFDGQRMIDEVHGEDCENFFSREAVELDSEDPDGSDRVVRESRRTIYVLDSDDY